MEAEIASVDIVRMGAWKMSGKDALEHGRIRTWTWILWGRSMDIKGPELVVEAGCNRACTTSGCEGMLWELNVVEHGCNQDASVQVSGTGCNRAWA